MYVLNSLQLQFSPLQHLIRFLKSVSVITLFTSFGKVDQIPFPWKDIVSVPKVVVACLKADVHNTKNTKALKITNPDRCS